MSIAPYEQVNGQAAVAVPAQQAPSQVSLVAQMADWAQSAQAVYQVCEQLQHTSFVPKHYQGKPQEMTAAMLAGMEVGLSQMASLRAFDPIQGAAAPKAITLRAIVLSRGHTLDLVESSATRAVAVGRRNGTGAPQTSVWTIERAQQAGYVSKNPMWKSQPEAMLIARATAECARLTAADAILGIPYAIEELEDGGPVAPVQATAEQVAAPARRRNQASVLPSGGDRPEPAPAAVPGSGPIDPKGPQRSRIGELFVEKGIAEDERPHIVSEVAGRPVGSLKDLTYAEAARLIERLEQMPAAVTDEESA